MVISTVKCFAHVGKKKVSSFPFINGCKDFIGSLNNNMQLTKQFFYCISYGAALHNNALHY